MQTNKTWLKILAMIAMIFDHFSIWLINHYHISAFNAIYWRMFGRISIPIFAFLIAYNFVYNSRHHEQFLFRVTIFALLSEPFYIAYFETFGNAFIPLAFGLAMIYFIDKNKLNEFVLTCAMAFYLAFFVFFDVEIIACAFLIVAFYCYFKLNNKIFLALTFPLMLYLNTIDIRIILMVFVSYFLIFLSLKKDILPNLRINKWVGYWFYPAHLFILRALLGVA